MNGRSRNELDRMAMYNYYDYGRRRVPQCYYDYDYPAASSGFDLPPAPVPFIGDPRRSELYRRDQDRYFDDSNYRRDYHLDGRNSDYYSRHGLVPREQVVQTDQYQGRADHVPPNYWWLNRDYPSHNGGHMGMYHPLMPPYPGWQDENETSSEDFSHNNSTTVEMYVPLCCEKCKRQVHKHLKDLEGVESVIADQWENKVVVEGHDLHPDFLLRRMQRDKPASVFWSDRPK